MSPLAIAIFLKYNSDPVITSLSQDIFKVLASNPGCSVSVQNRLVPTLVSILNASEDKNGLKGIALDVQSCLVRSAPLPLSDQLMGTLFPAAIQVTLFAWHCIANIHTTCSDLHCPGEPHHG